MLIITNHYIIWIARFANQTHLVLSLILKPYKASLTLRCNYNT